MENKESNNNGIWHKPEVNELIAAETANSEDYGNQISKASESTAEIPADSPISEQESEQEVTDESEKIIEAEKNMETVGDLRNQDAFKEDITHVENSNTQTEQVFDEDEKLNNEVESHDIKSSDDINTGEYEVTATEKIPEANAGEITVSSEVTEDTEPPVSSELRAEEDHSTTEEDHHEILMEQIKAHAEEEISEPLENYDSMSKEILIENFSILLEQDDIISNKNKAFAIREAFNKILVQERSEALARFVEEGGNKDDFDKSKDPAEEKFNSLFEKYKKKRTEHLEVVEKQKLDNLHAKQEILVLLKNLIQNEDNMQKAYTEFNELQNRWRAIGAVPAHNVRDLLLNYKLYVDRFYDFVKINRELQALDQKKNLLLKINLCERAEQLMLESSINRAIGQMNNLMYEWRETGPVPRDKKDELWQRFKAAVDKVFERRREHESSLKEVQSANLNKKQELITKLEMVAGQICDKHTSWQEALKEVMQITNDYKKIGHAPRKENEEVWAKFKSLSDTFFKNKNEFYQLRKKDNAANVQLKTELCIQAEGLKDSTDWKTTSQELVRLQEEWKKIGHIFDKQNQKLWQRFKGACDAFFNHKNEHFSSIDKEYEDNYLNKLSLVEEVEKFELGTDNQNNLDQLREFQRHWTEIGLVPIKKKDEIQKRFRTAIDKLYNNLNMDEREKSRARFNSRIEEQKEANPRFSNKGSRSGGGGGKSETGIIANKINALSNEVTIWQNNIGFFSKSKNAEVIRQEFEDKINKAKEEINMLKQKLKELKETN